MENVPEVIDLAVVDDDPLYRDYVCTLLSREGLRSFPAANGTDLLRILNEKRIDCVVMDYDLGTETGLNIAEEVRSHIVEPPPIVMLTGGGGERTAVKAFRGGFSDYVSKRNLNPEELVNAIRGAVSRTSLQHAERVAQQRLARLSSYDDETGLLARHRLDEILADVQSRAGHRGGTFALIAIEVFGFAGLKDQFGHVLGQRALHAFATRLKGAARATDIYGRYGDAGFLYILDRDPKPQTVEAISGQLARELAFETNVDSVCFRLRPIIGAAVFPADGTEVEQVVSAAHAAQRDAQARGVPFAFTESLKAAIATSDKDAASSGRDEAPSSAAATVGEHSGARTVDRRSERRQRILQRGQILAKGLGSAIDCTIRDLSEKGARLRVDAYHSAPEEFDLLFVRTGSRRRVRLRWQIGNDMGVEFVSSAVTD